MTAVARVAYRKESGVGCSQSGMPRSCMATLAFCAAVPACIAWVSMLHGDVTDVGGLERPGEACVVRPRDLRRKRTTQ